MRQARNIVTDKFQFTLPARGATFQARKKLWRLRFQSTLPARGATSGSSGRNPAQGYFNPRSPRGERRKQLKNATKKEKISIHAPREGSDRITMRVRKGFHISIHAPREGSDARGVQAACTSGHFNPRSPRGERLYRTSDKFCCRISIHAPREGSDDEAKDTDHPKMKFQSTLPARGATQANIDAEKTARISIHAPPRGERRTPRNQNQPS